MAHTMRNVSRLAHQPCKEKFLTGETNRGIGSVKRITKEAIAKKISEDFKKTPAERDASEEAA